MPRQYGSARIDCPVCKERVYPLEATAFEGKTYHKGCMKWGLCDISHPIQNQKDIIADGKNKRKKGSST